MVLLPNGGGDYRIIRLMEVVWKMATVIINCCLSKDISYHELLHGLQSGCRTGTFPLKAKLLHQLTAMQEELLCKIFMEPNKVYDTLDRDR